MNKEFIFKNLVRFVFYNFFFLLTWDSKSILQNMDIAMLLITWMITWSIHITKSVTLGKFRGSLAVGNKNQLHLITGYKPNFSLNSFCFSLCPILLERMSIYIVMHSKVTVIILVISILSIFSSSYHIFVYIKRQFAI